MLDEALGKKSVSDASHITLHSSPSAAILPPVDRHLKERLVGAAVLVAAAIILIPEMLSGPRDSVAVQHESAVSGASDPNGVKTYTIDLSTAKPHASEQPATLSQPFVETPPQITPKASAEESAPAVESAPKQAVLAQPAAEKKSSAEKEASEKPSASPPVADATATSSTATNDKKAGDKKTGDKKAADNGAWAVQVASFAARATSDRIASELKAKGYPAFVTAFAVKGQTMYRVRVGPAEDRAAAETLLKKIKPLHPGAAIVAQ